MPCTYPMIPITFSFFTKQADQRGGKVLPLALTYGIGIVVMFVLVGVLLSSLIVDIVGHWARTRPMRSGPLGGGMLRSITKTLHAWSRSNCNAEAPSLAHLPRYPPRGRAA